MWARRTRILVIGAVLTLGLLATVLLQSPAPTQTVDEFLHTDNANLVLKNFLLSRIVEF